MGSIKDYFPGFIKEYFRERRRAKVVDKAIDLAAQEKYADAAEVYTRYAPEVLEYGELLYVLYCRYAFEMWIKAKDVGNALQQARNALRILCSNDGEWLKYSSGTHADDLLWMAGELYATGYIAEADIFSQEVNVQLEKYDLPMRCVVGTLRKSTFPSVCPQCGGNLPYSPYQHAIECPFCETVNYAE